MKNLRNIWCLMLALCLVACGDNDDPKPAITLLAANINGGTLVDGAAGVPVESTVELVFSVALGIPKFESSFSISSSAGEPAYDITYTNASSKVVVEFTDLSYNTAYTVAVKAGTFGSNGQALQEDVSYTFTTQEDDVIRSMAPCTSASQDCYRTVALQDNANATGDLGFYANYPIYLENAEWEDLKQAIIVVHGANRDADNYFTYLSSTLSGEQLQASTVLIAPEFKEGGSATDLTWGSNWREGQVSNSTAKLSSFEAIDALIQQLSDKEAFPALKKVIVTGHSSGALFTQVYGTANKVEADSHLSFEYVVANSQYFYYPDNQRYDEQNNQFYTPTDCGTYNMWPMGYSSAPAYVSSSTDAEIDANLLGRSFTYFLGNGNQADGALNTTNCAAVLLGSSRFSRGENIFRWLETEYAGQHNSTKAIVEGIGHDGQGMYQSNEFKALLGELLQ
ncbi:Ig-like domain-containing protein [Roseivirga pacifica]|uniref:Ig-like domain-containing protein n=1 Tax=Roseivirga pacifica TaxID=1267423 RepID=UPI003BB21D63